MNFKKIFIILFVFNLNSGLVYSIEPDVFVQSTVNRASQILSENISKKEKIIKLRKIARETVDIKGIGLYSLGSKRKGLNDDQMREYSLCLVQVTGTRMCLIIQKYLTLRGN